MKSIWKYTLKASTSQTIEIPIGSRILSAESQKDDIVIYALVNSEELSFESYEILTYGTGHSILENIDNHNFLGTVKMHSDALVFHVFYKLKQ